MWPTSSRASCWRTRDEPDRWRARGATMTGAPIAFEMIVFLVIVALAFDFMNGFHDAANSIATVVSTRVLRPHYAVAWAAFFNFAAFAVFGLSVANTIGKGVIDAHI